MVKAKRQISRRRLAQIQVYTLFAVLVIIGLIIGFYIGKSHSFQKTEIKTIEVPISSDQLPKTKKITYLNIPISHSLQRYIHEICANEKVPVSLIYAMIEAESNFNAEAISQTGDYGLMQINKVNFEHLNKKYRAANIKDPYQNVFCGIKIISQYYHKYSDIHSVLMAYNMGEYGAKKAWESGITSTSYSDKVVKLISVYEKEVKKSDTSSND